MSSQPYLYQQQRHGGQSTSSEAAASLTGPASFSLYQTFGQDRNGGESGGQEWWPQQQQQQQQPPQREAYGQQYLEANIPYQPQINQEVLGTDLLVI